MVGVATKAVYTHIQIFVITRTARTFKVILVKVTQRGSQLLSIQQGLEICLSYLRPPMMLTIGARCGARTRDPEIKSLMLYRLS